jgi:hypothetical protein
MKTSRFARMSVWAFLLSTSCAMAVETDDPDPRSSNGEEAHFMTDAAGNQLAEARLEHFLSKMESSGEPGYGLGASQMIRFELRVGETATDAAAALRRTIDPGHSPPLAVPTRRVSRLCAGEGSFWVCCDAWSCTESAQGISSP